MRFSRFLLMLLMTVSVFFMAAGGGCRKKDVTSDTPDAPEEEKESRSWPKAETAWKVSMEGRLWPLCRLGDIAVLVSSTGEELVGEPEKLKAVRTTDGTGIWETEALLAPALVRTISPWSFSFATSESEEKKVVAYLRNEGQVTALDAETGDRLWTKHSRHGVASLGTSMVISDGKTLDLVDPVTGKETLSLDLSKEELGASSHGLASGLEPRTILQTFNSKVMITRADGGELQALDPHEGKLVWRYSHPDTLSRRLLWLPSTEDRFLLPAGYPNPRDFTRVAAWDERFSSLDPKWDVSLAGKGILEDFWEIGDGVLFRSEGTAGRQFVVRVEKESGERKPMQPISAVDSCKSSGERLVCRAGADVVSLEAMDGMEMWRKKVGSRRDRLFRVWALDRWIVPVTAFHVFVLDSSTGEEVWKKKKLHEGGRYIVRDSFERKGGGLILIVETTGSAKTDRRENVLLALNAKDGKVEYSMMLGEAAPTRRKMRVGSGWKSVGVPFGFIREKDKVFSGIGGRFRLIRAGDGEVVREYRHPGSGRMEGGGEGGAVLKDVRGNIAYIEAGDQLIAVHMPTATISWRENVRSKEVTLFRENEVFWIDENGGVGNFSAADGPRLLSDVSAIIEKHSGRIVGASDSVLIVRTSNSLLFLDRMTGKTRKTMDGPMEFIRGDGTVYGIAHEKKVAEKAGLYAALEKSTGKTLWENEVAFKSSPDALPAPVLVEQRWPVSWIRGASGMFITTDTMGRCVISIDARTGKRKWDICFESLTGPPVTAHGYLLLTAKGHPSKDARDVHHEVGSGANLAPGGSLFAVRLKDGKLRLLLRSDEGRQLMIGHIPPGDDGRLLMVDAPVETDTEDNRLLSIDLW